MSQMSACVSDGHTKCTIAHPSINQDPLRKNWHGPCRAIRKVPARILLCVSLCELCNTISGSSVSVQHLSMQRSTLQCYLPSWDPKRDPD